MMRCGPWLIVSMLAAGGLPSVAQAQPKPGTWDVTGGPDEKAKVCFDRSDPPGVVDDFVAMLKIARCTTDGPKAAGAGKWTVDGTCPSGRRSHFEVTVETPERMRIVSASTDKDGKPKNTQNTMARWVGSGCAAGVRRAGNFD